MDKISVISAKPVENLSGGIVEANKPKKKASEGKYLDSTADFDELTLVGWSETTMRPYSAEYFKVTAEDSGTRKQLNDIDKWLKDEMVSRGVEPTVKNCKKLLKELTMTEGIRTVDDFIDKKLTPKEEPQDIFGKKKSVFVTILKGLVNLMEEK